MFDFILFVVYVTSIVVLISDFILKFRFNKYRNLNVFLKGGADKKTRVINSIISLSLFVLLMVLFIVDLINKKDIKDTIYHLGIAVLFLVLISQFACSYEFTSKGILVINSLSIPIGLLEYGKIKNVKWLDYKTNTLFITTSYGYRQIKISENDKPKIDTELKKYIDI